MVQGLPERRICRFKRHQHMVIEGQPQQQIYRIDDGWACRYRMLKDGRRQITALYLPGDYCEPQWLIGGRATSPIITLTALNARKIPLRDISSLPAVHSDGPMDLFQAILRTLNRQSNQIVSLGRKTAYERLSELIYDLYERLKQKNRVISNQCVIPLTQQDIADIIGLTPVHVNRILQKMRRSKLIEWKARSLTIYDLNRLKQSCAAPHIG